MILLSIPIFTAAEIFLADILVDNSLRYICKGSYIEDGNFAIKENNFFDKNGQCVVSELIKFNRHSYTPVEFRIQDNNTGRTEEIISNKQGFLLRYREKFDEPFQEKLIKQTNNTIHGSYLPMIISANLNRLKKGDTVSFNLLVIDRLASYEFCLRNSGIKSIDGKEYLEISLEPVAWLVKQFVDPIHFYYAVNSDTQIARYHGTIAPRDANGKPQTGDIIFRYSSE